MADTVVEVPAAEPDVWFLVFQTRARTRWLSWIAMGRYKHVTAFGYVPAMRAWLFYDVGLGRTWVAVMPDEPAAWIEAHGLQEESLTICIAPRGRRRHWLRLGFWCVPAMGHLVGIGEKTFRPDALLKACMSSGAEIVPSE